VTVSISAGIGYSVILRATLQMVDSYGPELFGSAFSGPAFSAPHVHVASYMQCRPIRHFSVLQISSL